MCFLLVLFSISELKIRGVRSNLHTVNAISCKSNLNCKDNVPRGWSALPGCEWQEVKSMTEFHAICAEDIDSSLLESVANVLYY